MTKRTLSKVNNKDNRYILWFQLSNGETYYIGKDFIFLKIRKDIDFETFMATAKQYKLQGAKVITNKLWNNIFTWQNANLNGGHIVKSTYRELKDIHRYLKNNVNGKYYFNHLL